VVHGYDEARRAGMLDVRVRHDHGQLLVEIEDTGTAYDPRARALPTEEELALPIDERPIGGLGIYLAMSGVDELRYEQVGEKNRTTLVVRDKAAAARR
jgi:anti-sigma regulatory factor (Ser/Thr protein kinase)